MWFRWIFFLAVVLPALAQSEIGQPKLSVDAPDVAVVNQTIDVLVTSAEVPVSGATVFFSTEKNAQFQRITDESGTATYTPGDTSRLYVLAHKSGYIGAEVVIEVREMPGVAINGSATPEPTDTDARSPGFGYAAIIMSLVYLAIRNVRNR